jgi:hypothetical protein
VAGTWAEAQDEGDVMMQTAEAPRNKISEVIAEGPCHQHLFRTSACVPKSSIAPSQAPSSKLHHDA